MDQAGSQEYNLTDDFELMQAYRVTGSTRFCSIHVCFDTCNSQALSDKMGIF